MAVPTAEREVLLDLYEVLSPEAIRRTSERAGLPVDRITEVRLLDPYLYR